LSPEAFTALDQRVKTENELTSSVSRSYFFRIHRHLEFTKYKKETIQLHSALGSHTTQIGLVLSVILMLSSRAVASPGFRARRQWWAKVN